MDETLQDKITRITNELDALEQKGITTEEDINLRNQLINEKSQAEYELAQQEKIEEKVEAEAVPFAVAGVNLEGIPVEVVKLIETVVKADRRRIHTEHAIELEKSEQREKEAREETEFISESHRMLRTQYDDLQKQLEHTHEHAASLQASVMTLKTERDEALKLRDNAATQLEEAQAEIKQLKAWNDDLRKVQQFGERETQGIIDVTPDEQTDIAAALENVKKLYTKRENWGAYDKIIFADGSFEVVKRAEVDEKYELIAPEIGGSESGKSFLGLDQTPADNGDTQAVAEIPEVVTDGQFRQQTEVPDEDTTGGLVGDSSASESVPDSSSVTRQEFEALKADVEALKGKVA